MAYLTKSHHRCMDLQYSFCPIKMSVLQFYVTEPLQILVEPPCDIHTCIKYP